jgi:hypothetical protein
MDISDPTLNPVERDIAARLKQVCAEMSPESFLELVRDIARVKLKYGLESLASRQLHGPAADLIRTANDSDNQDRAKKSSI